MHLTLQAFIDSVIAYGAVYLMTRKRNTEREEYSKQRFVVLLLEET
jgi:hypothetical protein